MLRRCRRGEGRSLGYSVGYRAFTRPLKHWIAGLVAIGAVSASAVPSAVLAAETESVRLMVLGDSLTAGYGLPQPEAFPVKLEAALKKRLANVTVINAGVSGDTTSGGRARVGWALADKPTHVLVELGANDALRGVDPKITRENLDAIITQLKKSGVRVMIAGMYAPPNWGDSYEKAFRAIFPDLARKHDVPLYPFFLDGVAADRSLNQADGIHPNAAGVAIIVDRITPPVLRWLSEKE